MGIFDKFRGMIGVGEDIEDDEILEEEVSRAASKQTARNQSERNPYASKVSANEKVVNINGDKNIGITSNSLKLVVIEPKGFEESPKFVDLLKVRKPVILNLEKLDVDTARKIFDFLSGATYALNGTVQSVTDDIFVFAPESVGVVAQGSGLTQKDSFEFGNNNNKNNGWR